MPKVFLHKNKIKILITVIVFAFICISYYLSLYFTFDNIFENKQTINNFVNGNTYFLIVFLLALSIFFINSPIPMSALFMIMNGFLFGIYWGSVLNVISVTFASYVGFIFARYIFRLEFEKKYRHKLEITKSEIKNHGFFYFLSARFIFLIPNFVINIFAGISKISHKDFLLSTFLGSIIFSIIYANIGYQLNKINSVFDVLTLDLFFMLVFFAVISLFPIIMEKYTKKV